MTELLRKWAQHEPERCSFDGDTCRLAWRLDEPGDTTKAEMNNAMTLAATIEAIEARGWWWNVGTTLQLPVQAYVQSPERTFRPVRAETPAAALLGAYLAALEAEANQ